MAHVANVDVESHGGFQQLLNAIGAATSRARVVGEFFRVVKGLR